MNKHTQTTTSGSARRLAFFILIILILAMAVMLWNWAGKQGYIDAAKHSLTKYLIDADIFSNRSRQMLDELGATKSEIEQRLNYLEDSRQVAQNFLQGIEKSALNKGINTQSDTWILSTVEHLTLLSDRQLQLAGDVHSALILLKHAQELLQSSTVPDTLNLNTLLDGIIEQLEIQSAVEVHEISRGIERIAAQIDNFPLAAEAHMKSIDIFEKHGDISISGGWSPFLQKIGHDLGQLIKVEKVTNPVAELLSPTQALFLKENIRLQLMLARLALLVRDEESFDSAITLASGWIQRYFNTEVQLLRDTLTELERFSGTDIALRLPATGVFLDAIHHNQRTIKGEGE